MVPRPKKGKEELPLRILSKKGGKGGPLFSAGEERKRWAFSSGRRGRGKKLSLM